LTLAFFGHAVAWIFLILAVWATRGVFVNGLGVGVGFLQFFEFDR
jgi:hypothetical protein